MERIIDKDFQIMNEAWFGDLNIFLPQLESKIEMELIELFAKFGITATMKTDKYSLPYQDEVVVRLQYESYIAGMYERTRIYRPIVKKMLDEGAYKIRFYLHVETYGGKQEGLLKLLGSGLKYSFRYYIH